MITCLITGQPFPRGFRAFAISKIFINHVRIASLGGEISHVLVTSWGRGPICVVPLQLYLSHSIPELRDSGPCVAKRMAFWSAGPKCGDYFHAAESGRRCDQMPLSIPALCPCAIQSRPFGLPYGLFFLRHRGLSPIEVTQVTPLDASRMLKLRCKRHAA